MKKFDFLYWKFYIHNYNTWPLKKYKFCFTILIRLLSFKKHDYNLKIWKIDKFTLIRGWQYWQKEAPIKNPSNVFSLPFYMTSLWNCGNDKWKVKILDDHHQKIEHQLYLQKNMTYWVKSEKCPNVGVDMRKCFFPW